MKVIFRSLSFRLTFYSFLLTYSLLLGCWGLIYFTVDREFSLKDQQAVSNRLETIQHLLNSEPEKPVRLIRRVEEEWGRHSFERIYVRIFDSDGSLITETPDLFGKPEEIASIFPKRAQEISEKNELARMDIGKRIFDVGNFNIPVGVKSVLVQIAFERTSEEDLLLTLRRTLIYLLAFGFIGSLLSGRLTVTKTLKSIKKISETAQKVRSGGLKERVDPSSLPIEFFDFANTLNEMLGKLEESFDRLGRFSADMAHELRTPLNNLMGSLEVSLSHERSKEEYQALLVSNMEECARLKRIIDSLLFIARATDPVHEIQKQNLNLAEELESLISFYEASAEKNSINLKLLCSSHIKIRAEKVLLQRAIGNLLSNAIRVAPAKSEIEVRASEEGKFIVIAVTDQGSGIPAHLLPYIGERFFRAEASRSQNSGGNGLGLSIVKSIVESHGGHMRVKSTVGVGSTFFLEFPA
ncbi:MAG: heavy metal sensor histidine kinase [Pseudobdellovibrionaceae bacterium]